MIQLLPEQVEALYEVHQASGQAGTQAVIIGAIAYRVWIPDDYRMTEDLDFAIALDLDELSRLTSPLEAKGWRRDSRREHRWFSSKGVRVDLLPIGPKARLNKRIVWPVAGTAMSLVGFDYVFGDAVEIEFIPGLKARVIPLPVLTLLKIVSFLDQPHVRVQDIRDIACIMHRYEIDGERRFSDDVLNAEVDYDSAGAYLLGMDLGRLCRSPDDVGVVEVLLRQISDTDHPSFYVLARYSPALQDEDDELVRRQVGALVSGFHRSRQSGS
jgi:predicted nucleotidyltransferase